MFQLKSIKWILVSLVMIFSAFVSIYPESKYFSSDGEVDYEYLMKNLPAMADYLNNPKYPDSYWKTASPKSKGFDTGKLNEIYSNFQSTYYPGSPEYHSLLIIKDGVLVVERYGFDTGALNNRIWEPNTNLVQPGPYIQHRVFSTTKSFISALAGIAIQEGKIKSIKQKALDYCSGLKITNADPRLSNITIEQMLTMTSGIQWNDGNTFITNKSSHADSFSNYFNQPIASDPGTDWNYDSLNVIMIGYIIQKAVGMDLEQYAQLKLFQPMGIKNYKWNRYLPDLVDGGAGLQLTPRDMAKFGQLYLNKGRWKGKQIVPADWVASSTSLQFPGKWGGYGYLWRAPDGAGYSFTAGYGGQNIFVIPGKNMVVVFTSCIEAGAADKMLQNYIVDQIIPALK